MPQESWQYPYISAMAEKIEEKFPNLEIHVFSIRNDFFGERITVSGLITAQDLTAQLKGEPVLAADCSFRAIC